MSLSCTPCTTEPVSKYSVSTPAIGRCHGEMDGRSPGMRPGCSGCWTAGWGTCLLRFLVRRFAAAKLDEAAGRNWWRGGQVIGAIDETGRERADGATAGVKRQCAASAGLRPALAAPCYPRPVLWGAVAPV